WSDVGQRAARGGRPEDAPAALPDIATTSRAVRTARRIRLMRIDVRNMRFVARALRTVLHVPANRGRQRRKEWRDEGEGSDTGSGCRSLRGGGSGGARYAGQLERPDVDGGDVDAVDRQGGADRVGSAGATRAAVRRARRPGHERDGRGPHR